MGVYYAIDRGEPSDLASNHGWGQFCRWADGLTVEDYPQTAHLREYGWTQHAPALAKELSAALADHGPDDEETVEVASELLEVAEGTADGTVLSVGEGFTSE